MAMNGSGVRDTGRVLGISMTTVIAHVKRNFLQIDYPAASESGFRRFDWSLQDQPEVFYLSKDFTRGQARRDFFL